MDLQQRVIIANVRTPHLIPQSYELVYGGRALSGWPGSVLGNPFRVSQALPRGQAAAAYLPWLRQQCRARSEVHAEIMRLAQLVAEGAQLAIGCWCWPAACHAVHVRAAILGYAGRVEGVSSLGVSQR